MDKQTQNALLEEILDLQANRTPFLDEHWQRADLARYENPAVFTREIEGIHRTLPQIAVHCSELAAANAFVTRRIAGRPILLSRDEDGRVRAFYNVCRHRGAELVADDSGCQNRFRCPYHAWTYSSAGDLIAVPHEKSGFPGLDRAQHGLKEIACEEYAGWVWISLAPDAPIDVAAHLGDMAADILAMEAGEHRLFASTELDIAANWKILVEGGIESYHFRVEHEKTIAPLFLDNMSSYQAFGAHLRSVLPRSTLPGLREAPRDSWSLLEHANVLYSLFPGSQFLVQEDHFVWIQGNPISADRTRLRLVTMIPADADTNTDYWERHHALTITTLKEDFDLAEGIQRGLASGANAHLNFGRFEGALAHFNASVDVAIA